MLQTQIFSQNRKFSVLYGWDTPWIFDPGWIFRWNNLRNGEISSSTYPEHTFFFYSCRVEFYICGFETLYSCNCRTVETTVEKKVLLRSKNLSFSRRRREILEIWYSKRSIFLKEFVFQECTTIKNFACGGLELKTTILVWKTAFWNFHQSDFSDVVFFSTRKL